MAEPWEYQPEPNNYVMASSANAVEDEPSFYTPPPANYVEKVKETAKRMPVWGWLAIGVGGLVLGSVLVGVVAGRK